MKLKPYYYFLKYIFICLFLFSTSNLLIYILYNKLISYMTPIIVVILLTIIAFLYILFVFKLLQLLYYLPRHIREYRKLCKMIEKNQAEGRKIRLSYLYALEKTKCGKEIVKLVKEKYHLDF